MSKHHRSTRPKSRSDDTRVLDRSANARRGSRGLPTCTACRSARHTGSAGPPCPGRPRRSHANVVGRANQVDHREVDLDEVREVAERRRRVGGRHRGVAATGGELGDDPRRGGPHLVHMQPGLGSAAMKSRTVSGPCAPRRRPGETAARSRTPAPDRSARESLYSATNCSRWAAESACSTGRAPVPEIHRNTGSGRSTRAGTSSPGVDLAPQHRQVGEVGLGVEGGRVLHVSGRLDKAGVGR